MVLLQGMGCHRAIGGVRGMSKAQVWMKRKNADCHGPSHTLPLAIRVKKRKYVLSSMSFEEHMREFYGHVK